MAELYILHLSRPLWGKSQHYCGYTKFTAEERLDKHLSGNGSKFCAFANRNNISYQIVHKEHYDTIGEARRRERWLKRERNLGRHCSICQKEALDV